MLAIHNQHDQFTPQMRKRLKTTGMGLGLVASATGCRANRGSPNDTLLARK